MVTISRWADMKQDDIKSDGSSKLSKFNDIFRSLKAHFFIAIFLTGLACCLTMHVLIINDYEERAVKVKISEMQTQFKILSNRVTKFDYLQNTDESVINAQIDYLSNLNNGRLIVINDDLKVIKDTYKISVGKTIVSNELVNCLRAGSRGAYAKFDKKNGYISMIVPIIESQLSEEGDVAANSEKNEVVRGAILASVSTKPIHESMILLSRKAAVYEALIILIILGIAAALSRKLIKPFDKITADINEVKAGYTEDSIEIPKLTEAKHIVVAFNALLSRMKVLDDSRQEFVSNVSHELRTPITSMKVLADSLLSMGEGAPPELYRDFMEDIGKEVDREDKIIKDLLTLVRMDKKSPEIEFKHVDIEELIETVLKRIKPIAMQRDIELTFISKRSVTAEIDELKISQVITNLVENAVKYNNDGGSVKVVLDADHQYFTVKIIDNGVGIPEEDVDHVFERFYRVDKSRSREIGGTGLGLAIAKSAVLMHRGTIDVESKLGVGTTFTVKIPLIVAADK